MFEKQLCPLQMTESFWYWASSSLGKKGKLTPCTPFYQCWQFLDRFHEKKKFHIFQLSISLVGNWRQSLDLVLEAANNLKSDKFNFKFNRKSFRILGPRSLFLLQIICCQNKYIPHGKTSGSASKWEMLMFSFNFLS